MRASGCSVTGRSTASSPTTRCPDGTGSVRADYPDLPFILYTGRGSEEVASEAISAGATDYLQKQSGTEQCELLANRIRNAVGRYNTEQELQRRSRAIETSIDDLVTLATEGERASEPEPVDVAEAADACWRNVVTDGATLRVETDLTVRADPGRLHQVFENLFRNAVEHGSERSAVTADGEPERGDLTVTVGSCEGGFYVADNGTDVLREDRGRVFETGYSTSEAGTGYGLSIVREIANAHGWEVRRGRRNGRGSSTGPLPPSSRRTLERLLYPGANNRV
jgi:signal transduction histidine kinase